MGRTAFDVDAPVVVDAATPLVSAQPGKLPYSAEQALAITMIDTGLRQEAAFHRAKQMIVQLRAMGYELQQVRLI